MSTRSLTASALLATGLLAAGPLGAQVPLTPRALGMGGAYVATARGFESVFFNPANLGLEDGPRWSVAFPQISIGSSVLGPDVSDLPDFIDYDNLSDERRQELLASIPESGTSVDLDIRAPVAAVQIGPVGLGLSYGWIGEHTVGKDLVELFFEGYQFPRFDYRVGETIGTRASFWDVVAGVGHTIGPVSVGVAGHYYVGQSLVRTRAFEPRFNFLARDIEVDYAGVSAEGGSGYGLDVGVAFQPTPAITMSVAVANAVGSMNWDENLVGRIITINSADFENSEFLDLQDEYEASEREIGDAPAQPFAQLAGELDPGSFDMPTTLRLGAAWAAATGTELSFAYHRDLEEGGLGTRWDQQVGVGLQQKIPLLTLRIGASTDLEDGTLYGGGIKLGPLDLALAKFSTQGDLDDSDRDGWIGSFSVNVAAPRFGR